MTITLVFVTLIGLLVLGFSTPVALGASCLLYLFVLTDIASPTLQTGLLAAQIGNTLQSYVLPGIALFVLYGRLCAAMDIRGRFATSFAALFGGRRIAATIGEILASLIQPDTAGDALLQRNDDAAATVNRLRLAGTAGWSAIGQAAGLACLRVVTPPGIVLIILGFVFDQSIYQVFIRMLPLAVPLGALLLMLAIAAGKNQAATWKADSKPEWKSFPWVFAPIVILGSIFAGIVTPSEAAALAVAFALILGTLLGQMTGRRLLRVLLDTLYDIGAIFLVIVFAQTLVWVMSFEGLHSTLGTLADGLGPTLAYAVVLAITFAASALTGLLVTLLVVGPLGLIMLQPIGVDTMAFTTTLVIVATLGLVAPPTGAIFATLAVGTTERFPRIAFGIGFFALSMLAILPLSLLI